MEQFDIPVVIFIFKRTKILDVLERIRVLKPAKLYILSDYGRNADENKEVNKCRKLVEEAIDWNCEVIKNYATQNRGVYANIGEGAQWVLQREKWAIFLEDDNLPEITFFNFCKEMLQKYEDDTRILWICGTNYIGDYQPKSGASYVFTRHMLPCGWASWSNKFGKFYDGTLRLCEDATTMAAMESMYCNKKVYRQFRDCWLGEYRRISEGKQPVSWDYQMDFALKANNLFGICPCKNQIRNIGVDEHSIHGGVSFDLTMTKRFCGMDSYSLDFPLRHPKSLQIDPYFEKRIGEIILYPLGMRMKIRLSAMIRKLCKVPAKKSILQFVRDGFK